jgi:hypothetical protein
VGGTQKRMRTSRIGTTYTRGDRSRGRTGAEKTHTLRLSSISLAGHQAGRNGFVGADVDRHKGKVIGYDTVSGTFNRRTHVATLDVAAALRGGILHIHGQQTEAGDFTGKVTGGTGRFKGATGTVTGTQVSPKKTKVVVTYTTP